MRLREAFVAAALLTGCGSVSDNSNMPDAMVDAADTAAPMIVTTSPLNDAKKVSPLAPIVIRFDEEIDPASVTATTVTVQYAELFGWYDLAGRLVFDNTGVVTGTSVLDADANKIVFTPKFPLRVTSRFDVKVTGVKDKYGNMMADATIKFDTIKNTVQYVTNYSTAGGISSVQDFSGDNGQQGRYAGRLAGVDTVWFTGDDTFSYFYHSEFNADGTGKGGAQHSPGTDGKLGTSDDTIVYYFAQKMDGLRVEALVGSTAPGIDNMWGTSDDAINQAIVAKRTGDDYLGYIIYNDPGTDTIWLTADDKTGSTFNLYDYDAQHARTRLVTRSPGADQLPNTADDVILNYSEFRYDANGLMTHQIFRNSGSNAIWFDSDDGYIRYDKFVLDQNGNVIDRIGYNGAGTDNVWVSPDDVAYNHSGFTYYPNGLVENEIIYGAAGTDTLWGTPDDVITQYTHRTYDAQGAQISSMRYDNPGADGMWMMGGDDRLRGREDFALGY